MYLFESEYLFIHRFQFYFNPPKNPQKMSTQFIRKISFLLLLTGLSLQQKTCPEISMGTHPSLSNIVNFGVVQESWSGGIHSRSGIIRENRETDNIYLRYTDFGDNDPFNVVNVDSTNTDFSFSMFKANKKDYNLIDISVIYICVPIMPSTLKLKMTINIPGCKLLETFWDKVCGNILTPVPGLQAQLFTEKIKGVEILKDGLVDITDTRIMGPSPIGNDVMITEDHLELKFNLDFVDTNPM